MSVLSRRHVVGALSVLPWCGGVLISPLSAAAAQAPFQQRRLLMGTWVDLTVHDSTQAGLGAAAETAWSEMVRLTGLMNRFDPASDLSKLNRAAGREPVRVAPELMRVLLEAQSVTARTAGAFDATVGRLTLGPLDEPARQHALQHIGSTHVTLDAPAHMAYIDNPSTQLDLGGIAKLLILEAGMSALAQRGVRGAMINGGGDVLASERADGSAWRIGVRDAAAPEHLLAVLPLLSGVVASSGDYERFVMHQGRRHHHIVNPRSGWPTEGVAGVTLVASHVGHVNGLGAAAMVAGAQHGPALLQRCGAELALMVGTSGRVWASRTLVGRLQAPWDGKRQSVRV